MSRERGSEGRTAELTAAYTHCRAVAKREAKNFYWAFMALPQHKSDAMCAVYAFMRKADDLADDESDSIEARRAAMKDWTEAWIRSRTEPVTEASDPMFLAVNDVQRRFDIPVALLELLVAGTTLDLQAAPEGVAVVLAGEGTRPYQVYESFEALYRYCFLVASVVGLVTIRIFGYSDPKAEELAERTGIAFQLTNILRDVREDAERGRVYLPLDQLNEGGVSLEQLLAASAGAEVTPKLRRLLDREVERTQGYYAAGEALLPLIDKDARPAMRVLVTIYRRLLDRIASDPAAVFSRRVAVPTAEKMAVLGRGAAGSLMARWF